MANILPCYEYNIFIPIVLDPQNSRLTSKFMRNWLYLVIGIEISMMLR